MALFQSKKTVPSDSAIAMEFLLGERIAAQWVDFLLSFSAEMQSQLPANEYRELLRNMGMRFGERIDVGTQDTVEALEVSINKQLSRLQWGYCKLADNGTLLTIEHHLSPLPQALGIDADVCGGFLEGMYEQWFRSAGAEDDLSVKQQPGESNATLAILRFGRHA